MLPFHSPSAMVISLDRRAVPMCKVPVQSDLASIIPSDSSLFKPSENAANFSATTGTSHFEAVLCPYFPTLSTARLLLQGMTLSSMQRAGSGKKKKVKAFVLGHKDSCRFVSRRAMTAYI